MPNVLYFICPTDNIEPIINYRSNSTNYFYTSLGNSFSDNTGLIIRDLIIQKSIQKRKIILKLNNKIIADSLFKQNYISYGLLENHYQQIKKFECLKNQSIQNSSYKKIVTSKIINYKITELKNQLNKIGISNVKICGEIFDSYNKTFNKIYPPIIHLKKHQLN